ncbi:MAG TPA: glycosyltransferase [Alphaproteobacteria bacterium]|nr:glycosyltransferase [Alphaproteobacteria bacterium]
MRFLFMHEFFPGQYRHVAAALARDPRHAVAFATRDHTGSLPGVTKLIYKPQRAPHPETHHYLAPAEAAVLSGQAAARACLALKARGFVPDVICAHAGFGPALFIKEIFPDARLVGYFEWFYRARGSDADYLDPNAVDGEEACRIRMRNASVLLELAQADVAVCPTAFQRDQFPPPFRDKLVQLHDGIDTAFFSPAAAGEAPPVAGLPADAEVITYATRGMEPYRGFPQFLEAAAAVLERRPKAHVVIAGSDTVHYSRTLPAGETYKSRGLELLAGIDRSRLHFIGTLSLARYRALLRRSNVHVYLTVPFVLSWSLLEAMACGCLVVAADTAPVREVVTDGSNGLLVDFRDPAALAELISQALDRPGRGRDLRDAARRRIEEGYALSRTLPQHFRLLGVQ